MFTSYQTAILEYLLNHSFVPTNVLEEEFDYIPNLRNEIANLMNLGIVDRQFLKTLQEGYCIQYYWSDLLKSHFCARNEEAEREAEKKRKREIQDTKSERIQIIYSIVVSLALIVFFVALAAWRTGVAFLSLETLTNIGSIAGFALLVVMPFYILLAHLPNALGLDISSATALPAIAIGSTAISIASFLVLLMH